MGRCKIIGFVAAFVVIGIIIGVTVPLVLKQPEPADKGVPPSVLGYNEKAAENSNHSPAPSSAMATSVPTATPISAESTMVPTPPKMPSSSTSAAYTTAQNNSDSEQGSDTKVLGENGSISFLLRSRRLGSERRRRHQQQNRRQQQ